MIENSQETALMTKIEKLESEIRSNNKTIRRLENELKSVSVIVNEIDNDIHIVRPEYIEKLRQIKKEGIVSEEEFAKELDIDMNE